MMKKLLLIVFLLPLFKFVQAQEEIAKWSFPKNSLGDTVQNSTNKLNLTSVIRAEGTSTITMKNGATSYAAQATGWDNGMNSKNWSIGFITTSYDHVQLSSKQSAGGTNGGPKDFKVQFKVGSAGNWSDVPGGNVTLANDWTKGVISNLDLPAECQNQSSTVFIRWIMTSNLDVSLPAITPNGVSKIDDIVITGMLMTGLEDLDKVKGLSSFPNPSTSSFTITMTDKTSLIEMYNTRGQLVYSKIPENTIVTVEDALPAGMYFIRSIHNRNVKTIKHLVK